MMIDWVGRTVRKKIKRERVILMLKRRSLRLVLKYIVQIKGEKQQKKTGPFFFLNKAWSLNKKKA
jgi:hypothetical protein